MNAEPTDGYHRLAARWRRRAVAAAAPARLPSVLYVSYDGILEPLGESQIVAYLERLGTRYAITLISFEKGQDARHSRRVARMRTRLEESGIRWMPLWYHKWPPIVSTAFDVLLGAWRGLALSLGSDLRLVHSRGYVPALIGLLLRRTRGVAFLFDMRGFWADEKVDGGQWRRDSLIYRLVKRFERRFFESADGIISLTWAGVAAFPTLGYRIRTGVPVEVIPTCADLERFRPGPKNPELVTRLGLEGHRVVGCVGTMTNWYLREPMLNYLALLVRRIDRIKILIVTAEDHGRLRADAERSGVDPRRIVLTRAEFHEMPELLRLVDVGLFFIKVCFSKKGSAATKLGEFLATGVPVIINDRVGDSGSIVREGRVGVVLPDVTPEAFEASLDAVRQVLSDSEIARRCRDVARQHFDLARGVSSYDGVYSRIITIRA